MLTIKHKRGECIGCMACAEQAPDYWFMDEDGIAQLFQVSSQSGPFQVAKGFHEDRRRLEEAADSCPVNIIRIEG